MSLRRLLVIGSVLLAAAGGGAWWWLRPGQAAASPWTTAAIDRGRIATRVTASGTLSALVTVQVGSQVSGRIQSLSADFNSPVRKGQVLATIDPLLFDAAVAQAAANLASAQGNLAKAKAQAMDAQRQARRQQTLLEQRIITQADLDAAVTAAAVADATVLAAEAAVQQAQAGQMQAKANLEYTTIYSPIDGIVISRSVDVGQTVAASLSAPTLFTIAEDLRKMQVDTNVSESDVGRIRTGMATAFRVDAWPDETFAGEVRQVRNAPQVIQNVVTYDAVIDVANPDLRLKPGMTANVTFTVAEAENVLRLPNAALRFRPPAELTRGSATAPAAAGTAMAAGASAASTASTASTAEPAEQPRRRREGGMAGGEGDGQPSAGRERRRREGGAQAGGGRAPRVKTVWVLRAGQPEKVAVTVGITDGTFTEVVSGDLRDGDLVVTGSTAPAATPQGGFLGMPTPPPGGGGPMRRMF